MNTESSQEACPVEVLMSAVINFAPIVEMEELKRSFDEVMSAVVVLASKGSQVCPHQW